MVAAESTDRLTGTLRGLADRHRRAASTTAAGPSGRTLKRRLEARLAELQAGLAALPDSLSAEFTGFEWVEDNQHVIREALEQVAAGLPRGYLRHLPAVEIPSGDAVPRVLDLAEAVMDEADLPLDIDWIERCLETYQASLPLTIGELWVIPTFLRSLVARRLCEAAEEGLQLARAESGNNHLLEVERLLSGCVISLRSLAAWDWRAFVERLSGVERILAADPSGCYPRMDRDSRNRYRERVERLARRFGSSEWDVADAAVLLAAGAPRESPPARRHAGYYLIDGGVRELRAQLRGEAKPRPRRRRWRLDTLKLLYVSSVTAPSAVTLYLLAGILDGQGATPPAAAIILLLAAVPVLTAWTELINWLATQLSNPRVLPKLDLSSGIGAERASIVVVPCMLDDPGEIDRLLASLETGYLGNADPDITFVLLSDYPDADSAETDADRSLLAQAVRGIDELNARHGADRAKPFALIHRHRAWNENAGQWMGWERKRGKIEELNRWLLGADDTSFGTLHGDVERVRRAHFVITLDADTRLLPGTAARLVGTLVHPLNRPRIDGESGRVTAGYTVIQPRVDIHPASANRTVFSRVVSGTTGVDLYQTAVSEVYQDLFGEGIYAGKGIYDVRAFAQSVGGRVPANAVLSHDLLEGLLGRAALASDIVVLENASPGLAAEIRRQHRWVRGDWQLLPWLLPWPGSGARRRDVDLLGHFKLFDNLRRSLLPPALLALLFATWILVPGHALQWTLAVSLVPAIPLLVSLASDLRGLAIRWGTFRSSFVRLYGNFGRQAANWGFQLAALPVVAAMAVDAIARTLFRLTITRRKLLEWVTASRSEQATAGARLSTSYRRMLAAPAAGLAALAVGAAGEAATAVPAIFGTAWILAPALAWLTARERGKPRPLTEVDRRELRKLARCTWHFYDRFVGPETHWLPPDNYQEAPRASLAERTSPTNVGLFLLSSVAAWDLGYIGASGLVTRIDGTLGTLARLRQFSGHLFNWYSTRDLEVLPPEYVSTVDSGNLVAALVVCRKALEELDETTLPPARAGEALTDLVANVEQSLASGPPGGGEAADALTRMLGEIRRRLDDCAGLEALSETLAEVSERSCLELDRAVLELAQQHGAAWPAGRLDALRGWIEQLRHEAAKFRTDIDQMASCLGAARLLEGSGPDDSRRKPPTRLGSYRRIVARAAVALGHGGAEAVDNLPGGAELLRVNADFEELFALRDALIETIDAFVNATDFGFLYDESRNLFHIGYNNTTGELDPAHYDLLASEARIASLVAIAKHDVPTRHWLYLGRPLRRLRGMRVILSWSATSFEYLMPRLFMATPPYGMLEASCHAVIREQCRLARRHRLPWGVSESAYFEFDASGHYKYRAFGVDALALRRRSRPRYVVTPYASILALPFAPRAVVENLERLGAFGCWGRYGLYEALDFGEQAGGGHGPRLVQSFMAHHQGMILGALANALCDDRLLRRFHADARIVAVDHLLYEALPKRAADRVLPRVSPPRPRRMPVMTADHRRVADAALARHVAVLGNGHLTLRATGTGGGDISWNGRAITRWRPRVDGPTGGDRIYLQTSPGGEVRVIGGETDRYAGAREAWTAPHQSELHQRFGDLVTRLTSGVMPDNDVAIRRVTLTNEGAQSRHVVLTHYAEIVLAESAGDRRHPAFNQLFIAAERAGDGRTLLFSRRRRSNDEAGMCCAFTVVASVGPEELEFTVDRRAFLGRGGGYREPAALRNEDRRRFAASEDTTGTLDPVAAIAVHLELAPAETVQVSFVTAVSPDRQQALDQLGHFSTPGRIVFGFDQARVRAAAELTRLRIDSGTLMRLMENYPDLVWPRRFRVNRRPAVAPGDSVLSFLWSRGISGDHPIALVCVREREDLASAADMLILQRYLGSRGVTIDVVVADETAASYAAPMQSELDELIERHRDVHRPGRAHVLQAQRLAPGERALLDVAATVRVAARGAEAGDLRDRSASDADVLPLFIGVRGAEPGASELALPPPGDAPGLDFANGYGGLDAATGDYVIDLDTDDPLPAPWINVLANPHFGSIVSERGSGCTWYGNSSEQRLTPWYNDPVCDRSGEALYIRDEETGEFWSPTPGPRPGGRRYRVRHGRGFSEFEHSSHELGQRLQVFVDHELPVRFACLELSNRAPRPRRLTLTFYAEWVWGNHPEDTGPYIFTDMADTGQALLARSVLPRFGAGRVAFVTSTSPLHGHTTDRREFLGRERDPARPAALKRLGLSGTLVAGGEPCSAYQVHVDLPAGQETTVTFALGAGEDRESALALAAEARTETFVDERRRATQAFWQDFRSRLSIRTPNAALDALFNHWLGYQNLAARLWARTGFYQSAGGFGFRDQLQDSLALLHTWPEVTRAQILKACSVQFPEGDVLHWWHENPVRGVRTRCSDDLLWLPYAVAEYLKVTGDRALLEETVPWLAGEPLHADEPERYAEFAPGDGQASVYEHCIRAIDARATTGAHGLPLFGSGDWNDGLNRVGIRGRGESAWLGWFLAGILVNFAALARERGEAERVAGFEQRKDALVAALESGAWSGDRYLRGYYDDGSPLGVATDMECRIDLNAQTWPVITGLGRPERGECALDTAERELIDEENRLVKLLAPPFERTMRDPGYIRGYPPGVRENGGQYTHAAVWAVQAAARAGRPDRAMRWLDLLNPLRRVTDAAAARHYRAEPWVLPGDVYAVEPHTGRAGWTWYTGSAGWMLRIILEDLLGLDVNAGELGIRPAVPEDWPEFTIELRAGAAHYEIRVIEPAAIRASGAGMELDGQRAERIRLVDDGRRHRIDVRPAAAVPARRAT